MNFRGSKTISTRAVVCLLTIFGLLVFGFQNCAQQLGLKVTDPSVVADSNVAIPVQGTAPAITQNPVSLTVIQGSSATFSVVASGSPTLTYQWTFNGAPLNGQTSPSMTVPNVLLANGGVYAVTVTNDFGSAKSQTATLIVQVPPVVTQQPQGLTVNLSSSASFTVAATGVPTPTYQWFKNGVAITGATQTTFVIGTTVATDATSYSVKVSNAAGSVQSQSATLIVNLPPPPASPLPPTITQQPQGQTVVAGSTVTFNVVASGAMPMTYQWMKNGAAISANGTSQTLTLNNVTLTDAASYTVKVSNSAGSATSSAAVLVVQTAPQITLQPASQTVSQGSSVSFTVTATGFPTPTYQWYFGTTLMTGETAATLTIASAQPTQIGGYSVKVMNVVGSVTSQTANLGVNIPPTIVTQPASQNLIAGKPLGLSVTANGTPILSYQWFHNDNAIAGATSASYQKSNSSSDDSGSYYVMVSNVAGQIKSLVVNVGVGTPRATHTATLLADGRVLVTGGGNGAGNSTAEIYDPATSRWSPAGLMSTSRWNHQSILLNDGRVLVTGGVTPTSGTAQLPPTDIYDPVRSTWTTSGTLLFAQYFGNGAGSLNVLPNGKVLYQSFFQSADFPTINTVTHSGAEVFDPAQGVWTQAEVPPQYDSGGASVVLSNGMVLVASATTLNHIFAPVTAELYNPASGHWSTTGSLSDGRSHSTLTLLNDGSALMVGGGTGYGGGDDWAINSCEHYDVSTGTWSRTGSMISARGEHTAVLLPNGKVLVAGGNDTGGAPISTAEIFDPSTGQWTATGPMKEARVFHTATLLANGKVLVAGGFNTFNAGGRVSSTAEIYDPATGIWTYTGSM